MTAPYFWPREFPCHRHRACRQSLRRAGRRTFCFQQTCGIVDSLEDYSFVQAWSSYAWRNHTNENRNKRWRNALNVSVLCNIWCLIHLSIYMYYFTCDRVWEMSDCILSDIIMILLQLCNHVICVLKYLLYKFESTLVKLYNIMIFRWINKQLGIQTFCNWCNRYRDIYDWISQSSTAVYGEMSMVNYVICLFALNRST